MPTDMDAYRDSDEEYPSSLRRRRERKPWSQRLFSIFSCVVVAVIVVVHKENSGESSSSSDSAGSTQDASAPAAGDESAASAGSGNDSGSGDGGAAATKVGDTACASAGGAANRTVAFWQSEVDGCEQVPRGVTHVVFGFALVNTAGVAVPTFQNTDAEIRQCVAALRRNCIAPLGSIGGSTNNLELAAAADADAFAASAVALVDKFGFAGIDIDDETVGAEFNATRVVARVRATRKALSARDSALLLTYDAYFNEGEPSFCANEVYAAYTRCFPSDVLASVDWVNIMAYNVHSDADSAAAIYTKAINTTFADWETQLGGDMTKATIGICVSKSCAYGPGPSAAVIQEWVKYARQPGHGGMMVYAASGEVEDDFAVTRSVLTASSSRSSGRRRR